MIPSQTVASYALSKHGLITLTTTPKCSFKNSDLSPLQQPQNALSKTQTDHPYSSPKMLFQKPRLITLTAAPKCSFKNPNWLPFQHPQNAISKTRTDHTYSNPIMLFQKPGLTTLTVSWFVPNWCLSWFVSSWCSLIEGVINKIYNLLHHILG